MSERTVPIPAGFEAAAGGIVRDLVIGAEPPAAIADWRYLATFFGYEQVERVRNPVQLFDAAGLALFAEIPAVLQRELNAMAALLGVALLAVGHAPSLPPAPTALVAAAACFALRFMTIRRGWNLPVADSRNPDT